jgi:hypothetical protein
MSWWNTSATSHCVAGWATTLFAVECAEIEKRIGTEQAATIVLGLDAASLFYLDDAAARAQLQAMLNEDALALA